MRKPTTERLDNETCKITFYPEDSIIAKMEFVIRDNTTKEAVEEIEKAIQQLPKQSLKK